MSRTKDSGEEMRLLETMDNMLMAHLCFLMMCLSLVIPFQKRLKDDLYDYCKDNHFDYAREFCSQSSSALANHSLS